MKKKVINFLDKHRVILILLSLFMIAILFLSIKSILFFNHNFKALECSKEIDDTYCYYKKNKIFKEPSKEKDKFFKDNKDRIDSLKKEYHLPEYNFYTTYYYEVASLVHYNETGIDEDLHTFFNVYNNTYNIARFYKKNVLCFEIFYRYKIY